MESAFDSLQVTVPSAKVVGEVAVNALHQLPFPLLLVIFLACLSLFQWPASASPVLPTTQPHQALVQLPSPRPGQFVYLDKPSRQLVVSETPLLPPSSGPTVSSKPRTNRARQVLRAYRSPLGCVPEDIEMDPSLAV
ncbi:uncharacterized protein EHS24_004972 [Apiotrichum porosum]|uniref:Uncharacterized protein n=1 Tax=Apiotrichum porosum TaxID=105984 RepID=A0A427Y6I4_9TREE|nr:uncharacterized protein EHS24_004972 [Apiotrichum porosum]RSH86701.1 hypothetical protein EHS24_004972 [Apiotrichum porosum]